MADRGGRRGKRHKPERSDPPCVDPTGRTRESTVRDGVIIKLEELVAQIEALRSEAAKTERPEHRIREIVTQMRHYMTLVVKANVPRGFQEGDNERLRAHREEARGPQSDLLAVRQWLETRDNLYLLGGQDRWRLDELDWETKVWSPLYEWVKRGYELMFGGSDDPCWPQPVAGSELRAWEDEEQEVEWKLQKRISVFVPVGSEFTLDQREPFSFRFRGTLCCLGENDSFRIMERLVEARGHRVSRVTIEEAVGDKELNDEALRKAVSRLRERLRQQGFGELADRVKTANYGEWVYIDSASPTDAGNT